MRRKFLLGATKDNEIIFADVEITTRNKYKEFTASFKSVRPFNVEDIDLIKIAEDYIDDLGKDYAYDLCERFNLKPSELAEFLVAEDGVGGLMDLSLYPDTIETEYAEYRFESCSGGQYDSRKDMEIYVNKEQYDLLHYYWDNFHLKEINEETEQAINKLFDSMEMKTEEEHDWIRDYIIENDL